MKVKEALLDPKFLDGFKRKAEAEYSRESMTMAYKD